MGSLTAGGHTFKRVTVDGARLEAELARISEKDRFARFFLRKGCVITEVSPDDPALDALSDDYEPYVLLVDEHAS